MTPDLETWGSEPFAPESSAPDQVASVQLVVIVAAEAVVAAIAAGLFQAANSPALVAGLKLGLPVTVRGAEAVTVFLDLFASVAPGYPVLERSAAVVAVVVVAVVVAEDIEAKVKKTSVIKN